MNIACRATVRLPDRGDPAGTVIRFTCPQCKRPTTTTVPGDSAADSVLAEIDRLGDLVASLGRR